MQIFFRIAKKSIRVQRTKMRARGLAPGKSDQNHAFQILEIASVVKYTFVNRAKGCDLQKGFLMKL